MKKKPIKILFLTGTFLLILFTVALIPINLFLCNFPEWIVVFFGVLSLAAVITYLVLFRVRRGRGIVFLFFTAALVSVSVLVAYTIPYWNSYMLKRYGGDRMGFCEVMTYRQAEKDLNEAVAHLKRIHPMFRDGLTPEVNERYLEAKKHLKDMDKITVNDLHKELQWMIHPMHDAHTSVYANYPDERYLKAAPRKVKEGYTIATVNGMGTPELRELAKPWYSYESEDWISVDVGKLSTLRFYGISAPYTYVWENENGQVTEEYTDEDFVPAEEYIKIRDEVANEADGVGTAGDAHKGENAAGDSESGSAGNSEAATDADKKFFVYYEIDEAKSLAVLTLTECNFNAYYMNCVRKMFTEVKEKNIQNVAVDLRGNGGGNSGVANEFVRYLPVEEYQDAGADWRWNFLVFHSDAKIKNKRDTKLTFSGNVYILTDHRSFSSAMLFPQIIQDNKLGKVIGESPANSTRSYGDVTCFCLKESGLMLQISTKKWCRIDADNPEDYVIPDHACAGDEVFEVLDGLIAK